MNWGLVGLGFGLGTFKFLFAHWSVYFAFSYEGFSTLTAIFLSTTAGAWCTMAVFYFASDYFMKRAKIKKQQKEAELLAKGMPVNRKKVFTRLNKGIVRIKRSLGVYGITILAPLFLSIPGGAIVCAKFYGNQKKTFPLMLLFTASFSALMCTSIYFVTLSQT